MNKSKRKKTQIKMANDALVDVPTPLIIRGIRKTSQNGGF